MRQLWRLPGFGRLSVAYALNELAWFVGTLSLSLLVYRRTGSALGSAGFFLCSQGAPALLAPALVGRLDRFSPRVLLPALYFTEAVLFGALAYLAHRFVLAPVLVLVVVDGVIALVARSLSSGARTEILKPVGLVREGGALQSMMFSTAYLVGPLVGGAVAAAGGTVAALIVDCGLFAAMGLSLISRTIPRDIVHDGPQQRRLRAAVGYVRGNAPIARMLGLQTVAYACFSLPTPIEVVLCVHTLHAGSAGYGGLMAAWGGGAVLGSLLYARWRRRSVRLIIGTATVAMAIGFGVMSQSPDITVALVGAAVAGIGNGVAASAFGTEMMEIVPQSWVALVMSLNQSLGVLAPGIGIALGGLLTALFDVRATFGIAAGASVLLAGLVVWLLAPAKLAAPEDGPGGGADTGGASGPQSGIPVAASQGGGPARVGGSETDAATLA